MGVAERMEATFFRLAQRNGEEVTLWRRSKGLATALTDGHLSPVPRHPLSTRALFSQRQGGKRGGTARVYVSAAEVEEQDITSPELLWSVQRRGSGTRLPVTGNFMATGADGTTAWWSAEVAEGGSMPTDDIE